LNFSSGELGKDCSTVLGYFEKHTHQKMPKGANPAEYILECVGAGATAKVSQDFGDLWNKSDEAQMLQSEIDNLHGEYREAVKDDTSDQSYASPWGQQLRLVTQRAFTSCTCSLHRFPQLAKCNFADWRNPTYIISKTMLNIFGTCHVRVYVAVTDVLVAGLWIGFTFFSAKNTVSGLQVKLFSIFMALVVSNPLSQSMWRVPSLLAVLMT
jgi:ATP-binding cassette subfamily G (WHITE) protein 2 (SNQ2)